MNTRANPNYRISPSDLRLFLAVAEAGSITAGAHQIHLSLAAASTRLQKLEHAIGATVFVRSKQGVSMTDAGRTLFRHAGRLQRDMEALHAEMAAHAQGVRSTVRILCNTVAMTEYLPRLIGQFLIQHRDIDIDLRELDSQDVLSAMHQEQADIGIVADYVGTEGLKTQLFRQDRLVAIRPIGNDCGALSAVSFVDLLELPFVGLPAESGLSRFLQGQALHHGRGIHHRVRVRSLEDVVNLVIDGVGVAVIPEASALRLAKDQAIICPLIEVWATRRLLLCSASETTLGLAAGKLLNFLSDNTL
jgi:DNA-binding transcriptional LysR family regulator